MQNNKTPTPDTPNPVKLGLAEAGKLLGYSLPHDVAICEPGQGQVVFAPLISTFPLTISSFRIFA